MVLELIFDMTQASLLAYLWFCIQILINALARIDNARVRHPDAEKNVNISKLFKNVTLLWRMIGVRFMA